MILDKICYVHLRNHKPDGSFNDKGGATIAWVVDSTTGDIIIAKPARCSLSDTFRKDIGRQYAYNNLVYHAPQFIIRRETLVAAAIEQGVPMLQFAEVTPEGNKMLTMAFKTLLATGIENFMNSRWYEQVVRGHFTLKADNSLDLAPGPLSIVAPLKF